MLREKRPSGHYLELRNNDLDNKEFIRLGWLTGGALFVLPTSVANLFHKIPQLPHDTSHVAGAFLAAAAIAVTPALIGKFLKNHEREKAVIAKVEAIKSGDYTGPNSKKLASEILELKYHQGLHLPRLPSREQRAEFSRFLSLVFNPD